MHRLKFHIIIMLCFIYTGFCSAVMSVIDVTAIPTSCFEKSDGKITVKLNKDFHEDYQIIVLDSNNIVVQQKSQTSDKSVEFSNLSAVKYFILLQATNTTEKKEITISSPPPLKLEIIKIASFKETGTIINASLQAFPEGGSKPYQYKWSENTGNQRSEIAHDLSLGVYNCTVTDNFGCKPAEATFYLFEDELIKYKESNTKKK